MKKITQLKIVSLFLFVTGLILLQEKIDPIIVLGTVMALVGYNMITDIIEIERLEKQREFIDESLVKAKKEFERVAKDLNIVDDKKQGNENGK